MSGYWQFSSASVSNITGTVSGIYQNGQVQGNEVAYVSGFYNSGWTTGTTTDVDETTNTVVFSKSNVASLNGGYTAGEFTAFSNLPGEALSFDGVDDKVLSVNINPAVKPAMTFEAWVYRTAAVGTYQAIISNDNGGFDRALMINNTSGTYYVFAGASYNTGITAPLNTWEHVAATWSNNSITFIRNGVFGIHRSRRNS